MLLKISNLTPGVRPALQPTRHVRWSLARIQIARRFVSTHQLSSSAMSEKPDKMEALENRRKREKDARDRETDEEKEARRLKRREHEKSNRSQETEEQASARRTARRESERKRRESKSSEERSATNLKRRQDHANKVQAQKEAAGVTSIVGVREISSSSVSDTVHVSLLADAVRIYVSMM